MTEEKSEHWRVSKTISLEMVAFLILQSIAFTWFMSKMDSRVGNLEDANLRFIDSLKEVPKMDSRIAMIEDKQISALQMIDRISKLEQQVTSLGDLVKLQSTIINRIDRKLPTFDELDEQKKQN